MEDMEKSTKIAISFRVEFIEDTRELIKIAITFIIICILAIVIFFTFIMNPDEFEDSSFVCVETTITNKIVYHKETKVMYAVSTAWFSRGVFTMLVDEDGNPMIWEEQQNEEKIFK